jgi:hypothetical protein
MCIIIRQQSVRYIGRRSDSQPYAKLSALCGWPIGASRPNSQDKGKRDLAAAEEVATRWTRMSLHLRRAMAVESIEDSCRIAQRCETSLMIPARGHKAAPPQNICANRHAK